jgi:hypothetical protein
MPSGPAICAVTGLNAPNAARSTPSDEELGSSARSSPKISLARPSPPGLDSAPAAR